MFAGITLKDLACHIASSYRTNKCTGEATFAVGSLTVTVNYYGGMYIVRLANLDLEVRVNAWAVECYELAYGALSEEESAAALTYLTDACRALAATKTPSMSVTVLSDDVRRLVAEVEGRRVDVFYEE